MDLLALLYLNRRRRSEEIEMMAQKAMKMMQDSLVFIFKDEQICLDGYIHNGWCVE